jgi:hypothetical protein
MILNFSSRLLAISKKLACYFSLYKTYRVTSDASIDILWKKLINIADISWNPFFSSTDLPMGLIAKPGLIFQAVTKLTPIPVRIFVESVRPREVLSIRILAIPGIQQRIIYQVESTLCGSYISYSVKISGWLSPLIWWLMKPYSARVASELANAAEIIHK